MVFLDKPQRDTALSDSTNGWWFVVFVFPLAFFFQCFVPLSSEATGMILGYELIDGLVALRCIYGLIWQPDSRDWRVYFWILCSSVPFVGLVDSFTR